MIGKIKNFIAFYYPIYQNLLEICLKNLINQYQIQLLDCVLNKYSFKDLTKERCLLTIY